MSTQTKKIVRSERIKFNVQTTIAVFSTVIFIGKLIAYFLTNSVAILTDALESTVNVVTGFVTLYSIYISIKPKDEDHPFGHGKVEFLSASLEGFLIILAGIIIIFEAVKRLFVPTEIQDLNIGIIILAIAGLLNFIAGWYSVKLGKKNNSIALIAGGKHLKSDTYSAIGLIIGLLLLFFTKIAWIDSAIALIFATIIIITGIKILKETTSNLMDKADFEEIERFRKLIEENRSDKWIDIHNFRLVKYGNIYHIDCDLVLPWDTLLTDAHSEGKKLKKLLSDNSDKDIIFNLHIDECFKKYCKYCKKEDCSERKEEFQNEYKLTISKFTKEKKEN